MVFYIFIFLYFHDKGMFFNKHQLVLRPSINYSQGRQGRLECCGTVKCSSYEPRSQKKEGMVPSVSFNNTSQELEDLSLGPPPNSTTMDGALGNTEHLSHSATFRIQDSGVSSERYTENGND